VLYLSDAEVVLDTMGMLGSARAMSKLISEGCGRIEFEGKRWNNLGGWNGKKQPQSPTASRFPQQHIQKAITVTSHQHTSFPVTPTDNDHFPTLPRCGLPSCPSVAGWIQHRKAIVISTAINQTNHPNISWMKLLSLEDLLVFFFFSSSLKQVRS